MLRSCAGPRFRQAPASPNRVGAGRLVAVMVAGLTAACVNTPALLTQLLEARRLAADLHVEFTRASDAANRAVMADTDEASAAAADEARQARQAVERDLDALQPLLDSLGYGADV